jgi:hypothetical protein
MELPVRKMEEPEIPDGYRVRVAKVPEEIELLLEIFNTAFATRERYPPLTLEYFRNSRIFEEGEDQSGIFIAERTSDGAAVGMVISQIDRKFNEAHGRNLLTCCNPVRKEEGTGDSPHSQEPEVDLGKENGEGVHRCELVKQGSS